MHESTLQGKSHAIPKRLVWDAWLKVKKNGGAAGVDGVTIGQFEGDLRDNLFKLWNRMSSGSYFPGPVRAVEIPKKGGTRVLGIPNVIDRVAQTVAVMALEPDVEKVFHGDSYGYRPGRSPVDALTVCRQRCWEKDWVIDLDVKAFFDSVPWDLMLKAVACHTDQKWVLLYVERWLKAPMLMADGNLSQRVQGTPQGGPISPVLANLFLHYGFDTWMTREFPGIRFERFADDAVIHCASERQARLVQAAVARRLADVGLELHPDKTRIVYCQDSNRRGTYENTSFTFLSYTFRPRRAFNNKRNVRFTSFLPGASRDKQTEFSRRVHAWRLHRRTDLTIAELANGRKNEDGTPLSPGINPVLAGWFSYFTAFYPTTVDPLRQRIDRHLVRWVRRKYKRCTTNDQARTWLHGVRQRAPDLFAHWQVASTP
ncbi:MAG: group II intron reverse transcriptase/maturase [Pseudomonas sp.]|uniref:group II intron reverse transcriptase/maturase n=1 Tax=Pseudomonas sp. TaxID=306 RepID=UPI003D6DCC01